MEFNIVDILQDRASYKGLLFPMPFLAHEPSYNKGEFELNENADSRAIYADSGEPLYKTDLLGRQYFMPVSFVHGGEEYEIDCALISITRKKKIVETELVGRKGSVKELINIQDYEINIKGAVIGENKQWPEAKLKRLNELWEINEAVEIHSALTAVFLDPEDKVVITSDKPATEVTEHIQRFEINCKTDKPFELIIE